MYPLRKYLHQLSRVALLMFACLTWATAAHDLVHPRATNCTHHHGHEHPATDPASQPSEPCDCALAKCMNQPVLTTPPALIELVTVSVTFNPFVLQAKLPAYVQPRNFSRGPPATSPA